MNKEDSLQWGRVKWYGDAKKNNQVYIKYTREYTKNYKEEHKEGYK